MKSHRMRWYRWVAGSLLLLFVVGIMDRLNAEEADKGGSYSRAVKLYDAGDYEQALVILKQAFREDPGSADVNFLFGLAAMETKNYEQAVTAFDRVMMIDPGHPRVLVELAKCYYHLGLFGVAESNFIEAKAQKDIPDTVRQNIDNYLERIRQIQDSKAYRGSTALGDRRIENLKHFLTGSLTLSLARDDNASTSPAGTFLVPTIVGPMSAPGDVKRDLIYTTGVGLQYVYRPKATLWFTSQGFAMNGFYDTEKEYDVGVYGVAQGIGLQIGNWVFEGGGAALYLEKDYTDYMRAYGCQFRTTYLISGKSRVWISAFGDDRKYYQTPDDTGFFGGSEFGMGHAFGQKPACWENIRPVSKDKWYHAASDMRYLLGPAGTWDAGCLLRGGISYQVANTDANSQSNDAAALGMDLTVLLPFLSILSAKYSVKDALYDDINPFSVDRSRRRDLEHSVSIGVRKLLGTNCSLGLRHTFTNANSNVALYTYDRNLTELVFVYAF